MLISGFRGLGRIRRASGAYLPFRFSNADIALTQGINFFKPSYGGKDLNRIVAPTVGNVGGRISLILSESQAVPFYEITRNAEEIELDLCYRHEKSRRFTDCKIESLTFSCKAGELVQVAMDVVGKEHEQETFSLQWTDVQKLVTWDKAGFTGIFDTEVDDVNSFSYTIKNNLVPIRTADSLLLYDINKGIQEVSGNFVLWDVQIPIHSLSVNAIYVQPVTFSIDNLLVTHRIAHHWSYRTPLTPDIILTTLEWTRIDNL